MVMSLVASLRGVALIPAYLQALMPWSVVSRPLAGEVPTIDLVVGYSKTNDSPLLQTFLSRGAAANRACVARRDAEDDGLSFALPLTATPAARSRTAARTRYNKRGHSNFMASPPTMRPTGLPAIRRSSTSRQMCQPAAPMEM